MKKFLIAGAPAVGKSTLIKYLPLAGPCLAIDLEEIAGKQVYEGDPNTWTERNKRLKALKEIGAWETNVPVFVGISDLDANTVYHGFEKVLLHFTNTDRYTERVRQRNKDRPDKTGQDEMIQYNHMEESKNAHRFVNIFDPACFDGDHQAFADHIYNTLISAPNCSRRSV